MRRISAGVPDDYESFVRLFAELLVPERAPTRSFFEEQIAPAMIVLRHGDEVAGYAFFRARGERLHLAHLVTSPAHRRTGVGRALMAAVAERGIARGFREWILNVRPDNAPARALYESFGLRPSFEAVSMELAWSDVHRFPASDARAGALAASDEARFESALKIRAGEIGGVRAVAGRLAFAVEDTRGPAGVCVFEPSFPGAPMFRARSLAAARALLDAMRPHALHDASRLFIEDDPELSTSLAKFGAKPLLRVLRMEGAIPSA